MDIVAATGVYFTSGRKREESSKKGEKSWPSDKFGISESNKILWTNMDIERKIFAPWHGNLSQQTEIVTE